MLTPYRLVIFASRYAPKKKLKRHTVIERIQYGYDGWTPVQYYREARLPSAGSFLYPGMHAVRRAAMEALAIPNVTQVSVRTNQDKKVYIFNKNSDGRITGYVPDNDRF